MRGARSAGGSLLATRPGAGPWSHRGARDRACRAALHDQGEGEARAVSTARPDRRGAALPALAQRHRVVGPAGLARPGARRGASPRLRVGQRGQGDAARGLSAQDRQPRAQRRRADDPRSDDHRLGQPPGERGLRPGRRRRPAGAGEASGNAALRGRRLLDRRAHQRTRPGSVLPRLRPPHPSPLPRLRALAAVVDRPLPALGVLALLPGRRLRHVLQGRLAPNLARQPGA